MIYTIKNPCNEIFYNLVADAKEDIKLVAPFVKSGIVNKILQIKTKRLAEKYFCYYRKY